MVISQCLEDGDASALAGASSRFLSDLQRYPMKRYIDISRLMQFAKWNTKLDASRGRFSIGLVQSVSVNSLDRVLSVEEADMIRRWEIHSLRFNCDLIECMALRVERMEANGGKLPEIDWKAFPSITTLESVETDPCPLHHLQLQWYPNLTHLIGSVPFWSSLVSASQESPDHAIPSTLTHLTFQGADVLDDVLNDQVRWPIGIIRLDILKHDSIPLYEWPILPETLRELHLEWDFRHTIPRLADTTELYLSAKWQPKLVEHNFVRFARHMPDQLVELTIERLALKDGGTWRTWRLPSRLRSFRFHDKLKDGFLLGASEEELKQFFPTSLEYLELRIPTMCTDDQCDCRATLMIPGVSRSYLRSLSGRGADRPLLLASGDHAITSVLDLLRLHPPCFTFIYPNDSDSDDTMTGQFSWEICEDPDDD